MLKSTGRRTATTAPANYTEATADNRNKKV